MSYYVSKTPDGRDAREIVSATGHVHAADIAYATGMVPCVSRGNVYVNHTGDLRAVTVENEPVSESPPARNNEEPELL
jgi:hypothetical protein